MEIPWLSAIALVISALALWQSWKSSNKAERLAIEANEARHEAALAQRLIAEIMQRRPWRTKWLTDERYRIENRGADAFGVTITMRSAMSQRDKEAPAIEKQLISGLTMESGSSLVVFAPNAWWNFGMPFFEATLIITYHRDPDCSDPEKRFQSVLDFPVSHVIPAPRERDPHTDAILATYNPKSTKPNSPLPELPEP